MDKTQLLATEEGQAVVQTQEELNAAVKSGNKEAANNIMQVLIENNNNVTKAINMLTDAATTLAEDAKKKAAETDNISKFFANADESEKKAIYSNLVKEYGVDATNLELFGGSFEKALLATATRKGQIVNEQAYTIQKTHDLVMATSAIMKGIQPSSVGEDATFDSRVVRKAMDLIEKSDHSDDIDVDLYRKASGDVYDSATAGDGLEFIPTNLSSNLVRAVWLDTKVAQLFKRIQMSSPTFKMPRITSRGRAYLMSEVVSLANASAFFDAATGLTNDGFDTSDITFTARKFSVLETWNDEIEEDAVVPMAQLILEDVVASHASTLDDVCLNGNRSGYTNTLDNADASAPNKLWTSTADARYGFDGVRKYFQLSTRTGIDGSTFALTDIRAARKGMGKYGIKPSELVYIVSPNTYINLLEFDEVLRWRDIQNDATVLTGQLGQIDGIPIVVSEYIYTNLNASGVYDNTTTTKTVSLLVRPSAYMFGDRRSIRVEYDRNIFAGINGVVSTWRGDFKKLRPGTTTAAQAEEYVIINHTS